MGAPYVLVRRNGNVTSYRDEGAPSGAKYVVTAVLHGIATTAQQLNDGLAPGFAGVPAGEGAAAKSKGFIPAPGLALALLALGVAFVLVRRKL